MIKDRSASSITLDIVVYAFMTLVMVVTLYPVLHVVAISMSGSQAISAGKVSIFPVELSFDAYRRVLVSGTVPRAFFNSICYTLLGTTLNMLFTVSMAYALSKKHLTFRNVYTGLVMFTMFFGGGLIPTYLLVAKWLSLYDTVWAMVLPGAVSTWNLVVMRTFFQAIPVELEESAFLDGANDIQALFWIVLPLSQASIATIGLFYAVGHWNAWFNGLIYLKSAAKYPLQLILRSIIIEGQMAKELAEKGAMSELQRLEQNTTMDAIKYATLCLSMAPMLLVYPFVQKYFVKGVMIGSLKG